jgi:hypothetical protein
VRWHHTTAPRWDEQGEPHHRRGGYYKREKRERHEATSSMEVPGAWAIFIRVLPLVLMVYFPISGKYRYGNSHA